MYLLKIIFVIKLTLNKLHIWSYLLISNSKLTFIIWVEPLIYDSHQALVDFVTWTWIIPRWFFALKSLSLKSKLRTNCEIKNSTDVVLRMQDKAAQRPKPYSNQFLTSCTYHIADCILLIFGWFGSTSTHI